MRTVRRLRLRCFSFYDYRCRAVHSVTLCPVETMQAHQKHTVISSQQNLTLRLILSFSKEPQYVYGGPGGIRTPVQNTFLDNSLRCSSIYYTIKLI